MKERVLPWEREAVRTNAHLFKDLAKLVEAIRTMNWCKPDEHPIHSQSVYLKASMLEVLRESYGITPWIIEQCVGDLVVIPAGAAHQVCAGNYKLATRLAP